MISCQSPDKVVIPKGTLSEAQMVEILTDIHLIEGAKVGNKIMGDTIPAPVYFRKVYKKYNITEQEFEENYGFYSRNPKLMTAVYQKVIENLSKMEVTPPKDGAVDEITREQSSISAPLKSSEKLKPRKENSDLQSDQPE